MSYWAASGVIYSIDLTIYTSDLIGKFSQFPNTAIIFLVFSHYIPQKFVHLHIACRTAAQPILKPQRNDNAKRKMRDSFIVETEDDAELFDSLTWQGAEAFAGYLSSSPDDFDLATIIAGAAYCTRRGIEIDDDTRICKHADLYYFNDCRDLHYEHETDLDIG